MILQVDGGISLTTIAEAASAGANCFVAGSAVYKDANPAEIVAKTARKLIVELHKCYPNNFQSTFIDPITNYDER